MLVVQAESRGMQVHFKPQITPSTLESWDLQNGGYSIYKMVAIQSTKKETGSSEGVGLSQDLCGSGLWSGTSKGIGRNQKPLWV